MRFAMVVISILTLQPAQSGEPTVPDFAASVEELRAAAGLWNVTTTQHAEDGSAGEVVSGTYRFDWIVPDRVLAGRSDIPELQRRSGILFYVNERRATIEMASVGADGHLWVMTGPAGGDTRTTPDTPLADGRKMRLRFTRFNVTPDRFESRMEVSFDGGASWTRGNHQIFVRATAAGGVSADAPWRRPLPYVPLT